MRIQYLVDRELDVISGGATSGGGDEPPPPPPVPTNVLLETPGGNVVTLPFLDDSIQGLTILEHVDFATT